MKNTIFCYSATGNTILICEYICGKLPGAEIIDVTNVTTFARRKQSEQIN